MRLLSIILMIGLSPMLAKDYYVSPNGSDNNSGTESQPFKTIQKAANIVNPGDIVYIKKGIYPDKIEIKRSGTSRNNIVFKAFPGDELEAIIEGRPILIMKSSYIEISGLRVQNVMPMNGHAEGIYVEGPASNITIKNNHTYNTLGSGISAWGVAWRSDPGDFNNITDLKILNNKVEKACNGGYNECITLSNGVNGFEISGNEIFNGGDPVNGGEGIDVKLGVQNGIISNNYLHDLTRRGIYIDAAGILNFAKPFAKKIEVFNNTVKNCIGQGMAVMTEGKGDIFDIDIYNNVFYENTEDGLMFYDHPGGNGVIYDIRVYNNTCYNNQRFGILLNFPRANNMSFTNNLLYKNNNADLRLQNGNSTSSNNLVEIDPLFVNADQGNFRLKSDSPAIDAGTSINAPSVDFDGNLRNGAIDIGAFEFTDGTIPQPQIIANGVYNIISNKTNQNLIAPIWNDHKVRMYDAGNFKDQQWEFEHKQDNLYTIKNRKTQRYLGVVNNSCDNGSKTHTTIDILQWKVEQNGNGIYAIKPDYCLGKALDIPDGNTDVDVHLWSFNTNNENQKWKIKLIQDSIVSKTNLDLRLYPNPVQSNLHINGVLEGDIISIYNITGKKVIEKKVKSNELQTIDISKINSGIYILSVSGKYNYQLIKQ